MRHTVDVGVQAAKKAQHERIEFQPPPPASVPSNQPQTTANHCQRGAAALNLFSDLRQLPIASKRTSIQLRVGFVIAVKFLGNGIPAQFAVGFHGDGRELAKGV